MTHRTRVAFLTSLTLSLGAPPPSLAHAEDAKRACVAASTEGQTLRKDDKLLAARDKLRVCANDPCPSVVKSRCARWLGEVEGQIPTAIVRAKDAAGGDVLDAEVTLDGRATKVGRPETLDPGEHVVAVKRASGASVEKKFLLVDGDKGRVLTVQFPGPAPSPDGTADSTDSAAPGTASHAGGVPAGAWVLGGVSLVALGSFAFFVAKASDDLSTLRRTCAPACTDADTSSGRTHAMLADVSLGVGIGAAGAALAWAIFGRSSGSAKTGAYRPVIDVRPTAGGAFGTFAIRY